MSAQIIPLASGQKKSSGDRNDIKLPARMTEEAVSAWLNELPLANSDYSAQSVLALLYTLNQTDKLSCAERFTLLELLRPIALMLAEQLILVHVGTDASFPLTPLGRQQVNRSCALCMELGRAFRRIVANNDFFSDWALDDTLRSWILYRGLEAYGEALLRSLENYQPAPRGFWQDIFRLFRLAEQRGLHTAPVRGLEKEFNDNTVLGRFKHILLLSVANCHRHRPREIRQIHAVLMQFAPLTHLEDVQVWGGDKAFFGLDLRSDDAPRQLLSGGLKDAVEPRYLFTQDLVKQAARHYSDAEKRRLGNARLRRSMLKRLIHSLSGFERRKAPRHFLSGERTLIVGLSALSEKPGSNSAQKPVAQVRSVDWRKADRALLRDDDDEISGVSSGLHKESPLDRLLAEWKSVPQPENSRKAKEISVSKDVFKSDGQALSGWMMNTSARGYCLIWTRTDISAARVGELVGVPTEVGDFNIGVVRWLSHDGNDNLLLGIELVTPRAVPVGITIRNGVDDERFGLYVPPNQDIELDAGLLTQPASFHIGQVVDLQLSGGVKSVRIVRLVEATFSFNFFEVSSVESPEEL